ncbi:MAG: DUF559 domain-containing protein [Gemmatimonadales bacterium]|nr:MAG: DUF559 domain-containing protein [Gemmatimonadales bacterium]
MKLEVERAVWDLAHRQRGVVTRDQVLAVGWSPWALNRRVQAGLLRELFPRVYMVGAGEPPGAREQAALLVAGEGALLSHQTAAAQWGFLPPASGEPIHVMLVGTERGRVTGLRTHRVRRLQPEERSERAGFPLTSPARTMLDVAAVVGGRKLERLLSGAERSGLVPAKTWPGLLVRYRGRPGVAALRAAMEIPKGPAFTRSAAEDAFLDLVRRAALPRPESNVALESREIDFLWREECVAVEVDGYEYHRTRRDFDRDRAKDAWLIARGFRIVRLSWHQIVEEPLATAVLLGQVLARGGPDAQAARPAARAPATAAPATAAPATAASATAASTTAASATAGSSLPPSPPSARRPGVNRVQGSVALPELSPGASPGGRGGGAVGGTTRRARGWP